MIPEVSVSPVLAAECAEVAALIRSVIEPLSYYNARAQQEELAKYTAANLQLLLSEDASAVLIARQKHHAVGFCISRYDDGILWLAWFGVHPDVRGRGIARALLTALSQSITARRTHKIWCDTRTDNVRSQAVLKRFGFRQIAELSNHWYGQDFFLWEWYPDPTHPASAVG